MKNGESELGVTAVSRNGQAYAGRRKFTRQFKISAVKMVTEDGASMSGAARTVNVSVGTLARWVKNLEAASEHTVCETGLTTLPKQELELLRTEVQRLRVESDVLKGLVGYFARKESDVRDGGHGRAPDGSRQDWIGSSASLYLQQVQ